MAHAYMVPVSSYATLLSQLDVAASSFAEYKIQIKIVAKVACYVHWFVFRGVGKHMVQMALIVMLIREKKSRKAKGLSISN